MARQQCRAGSGNDVCQKICPVGVSGWQESLIRLVGDACGDCHNECQKNMPSAETDSQQQSDAAEKTEVGQFVPRRRQDASRGRSGHKQRQNKKCGYGKTQCRAKWKGEHARRPDYLIAIGVSRVPGMY